MIVTNEGISSSNRYSSNDIEYMVKANLDRINNSLLNHEKSLNDRMKAHGKKSRRQVSTYLDQLYRFDSAMKDLMSSYLLYRQWEVPADGEVLKCNRLVKMMTSLDTLSLKQNNTEFILNQLGMFVLVPGFVVKSSDTYDLANELSSKYDSRKPEDVYSFKTFHSTDHDFVPDIDSCYLFKDKILFNNKKYECYSLNDDDFDNIFNEVVSSEEGDKESGEKDTNHNR